MTLIPHLPYLPWALALEFLALLGLHYIPQLSLHGNRWHPVINYVLGVAAVMLPLTCAIVEVQVMTGLQAAFLFWLFFAAGGLSVAGMYGWDKYRETLRRNRELAERLEQERQLHGSHHDEID